MGRVRHRTLRRVCTGELCGNGNREKFFTSFFSRPSVIGWSITTHARRYPERLAFMDQTLPPGQMRLRRRSPRETARWLESVRG